MSKFRTVSEVHRQRMVILVMCAAAFIIAFGFWLASPL